MNSGSNRWLWVGLCVAFAGLMLLCGWLVPLHLRAVDASVLQRAGEGSLSLVDLGMALERANNTDSARMILQAAQNNGIRWTGELASTLEAHAERPRLFPGGPLATGTNITALVLRLENRDSVLAGLRNSGSPAVRELLRTRELTNTVIFPPSSSASGQAYDAAVSVCGLLLANNRLAPGLCDALVERAVSARARGNAQPLEEMLMDFMSLGQRLSWEQLSVFVNGINSPDTLSQLAFNARNGGAQMPTLFAAVLLSQKPDGVAAYLKRFSQTGLADLGTGLRYGRGGMGELLARQQRPFVSSLRARWAASPLVARFCRAATDYALRTPWFALMVKWFFYLSGGFLLAAAAHFARPPVAEIEEPLRVRGFHLARELLFALGFLLVVLLLSEPFLAQESQKLAMNFGLRLPVAGAAASSTKTLGELNLMNPKSMITLLLFFVLQGLLYCASVVKLAEIRRQKVPARVQLKLLENEEHLFDAGLYLGFAGTIVCLILVSLGIIQQSLMAAYSSTSFGVIFVSVFKIFNLRPVRRQVLMQAEAQGASPEPSAPATRPLAATP
jgi:hypothetical protein